MLDHQRQHEGDSQLDMFPEETPSKWRFVPVLVAVAVLALIAFPAFAQTLGTGPICDTEEQMIAYMDTKGNVEAKLERVNQGQKPMACNYASLAYIRGDDVGQRFNGKIDYVVTKITVVAFHNGQMWVPIAPLEQYTAYVQEGDNI